MPRVKKSSSSRNGARPTGSALVIREMELGDVQEVFALGTRLFTAERWPTLYRSWDEYEVVNLFSSDGDYCLVAEKNGRILGFALGTLMRKPRNPWCYGWLLWLGVSPRHARKGIAARLVRRLTELFIEEGARMMLVDTDAENRQAIRFFEREGFGGAIHHVYLSQNLESHPRYIEKREKESEAD